MLCCCFCLCSRQSCLLPYQSLTLELFHLIQLRLKRAQELEIPCVLVHCAMEEEAHNPYYTLIACKICGKLGRCIKVVFMFSLWDIFKWIGKQGDLDKDDKDDMETRLTRTTSAKSQQNPSSIWPRCMAPSLLRVP